MIKENDKNIFYVNLDSMEELKKIFENLEYQAFQDKPLKEWPIALTFKRLEGKTVEEIPLKPFKIHLNLPPRAVFVAKEPIENQEKTIDNKPKISLPETSKPVQSAKINYKEAPMKEVNSEVNSNDDYKRLFKELNLSETEFATQLKTVDKIHQERLKNKN